MNEESQQSTPQSEIDKPQKSWLERIGQALQGDLKDRVQLLEVLQDAEKNNLINNDALSMIEGVLGVSDMQVRDIMIPRSQMTVVERDAPMKENLKVVVESAHSRFPAIGESRDEIIGILLAKDLLPYYVQDKEDRIKFRDLLRPAIFIPESKRLNVLLKEFRANRNHMAIVVDEYGGVAGLVTIEDVIEQIIGDIEDEHDFDEDTYIFAHQDGDYTVKAITPIDDFNEYFKCEISKEEFDTIGGLVMNGFGHMPERGETIDIGPFCFKVLRASNRQIHLLNVVHNNLN